MFRKGDRTLAGRSDGTEHRPIRKGETQDRGPMFSEHGRARKFFRFSIDFSLGKWVPFPDRVRAPAEFVRAGPSGAKSRVLGFFTKPVGSRVFLKQVARTASLKAMGKKPAARAKPKTKSVSTPKARIYRTSKHVEALRALSPAECNEFFEKGDPERLCRVFEDSYPAELVNLLLDLKKATVRRFFEVVRASKKRGLAELATLYYYKDYLTNPLPLIIDLETGESVPNYYAILGVPRDVADEDLKTAYRLLAKALAPESFPPEMRKSGAERLADIKDAFQHLKSPKLRAKADKLLPNINYLYPRRDQSWLEAVQRLIQ